MKKLKILLVIALVLIGIFFVFKCCRPDFSGREFEKYQSDFEVLAEIVRRDYETLNEEKCFYWVTDGNVERWEDTEHIVVIDKESKELERIKSFSIFGFDGVDVSDKQIMFSYGCRQEYVIHTYNGKKPDYSFFDGLDFYTGKLADGWYIANLRQR